MSSLTRCNHCTLADIRRRAAKDGVEVNLLPAHIATRDGEWFGWWAAMRPDRDEPVAFFMAVTEHCAC